MKDKFSYDNIIIKASDGFIKVPYRIQGSSDYKSESELLLLTRHGDGFIRQAAVDRLINMNIPEKSAPYFCLLIGEYVVEIIILMLNELDERHIIEMKQVLNMNPEISRITRERLISYWDCYYRHKYIQIDDYPGTKLFNKIMDI